MRNRPIVYSVAGFLAILADIAERDRELATTVIDGECRETPAIDPPALRLVAPPCP